MEKMELKNQGKTKGLPDEKLIEKYKAESTDFDATLIILGKTKSGWENKGRVTKT